MTLAVGPEGGWSVDEVEAAVAAGFRGVTLGRLTFRADAVVACATAVLLYVWGDL
ncbi:MAG: 16S rRNA (uracil(1498)-N(3))-methyltransferase [Acidobacteria bacterium]|nr:16S rRNA (uracil(1498)-N(3))-methyltransferase [Acidobacteriota bacterium]